METAYDLSALPPAQMGSDKDYKAKTTSRFLPRLTLYSGMSKAVQRRQIASGSFGIAPEKDKVTDLGDKVDVMVFATKRMAIDMSSPTPVRSFDPSSDEYKRIAAKCDSGAKDTKCQYGSVFLLYERSLGQFVEFFYGAATWAEEAEKLCGFLPLSAADIARKAEQGIDTAGMTPRGVGLATITSTLIERPGRSWYVPVGKACSTPFTNAPEQADVEREMLKFLTVVKPSATKVSDDTGRAI